MKKQTKADPISIRLEKDEMERVRKVLERFRQRYPFAELKHFIRVWLGLSVEYEKAFISTEERDYLSGKIDALSVDGKKHGPFSPNEDPVIGDQIDFCEPIEEIHRKGSATAPAAARRRVK